MDAHCALCARGAAWIARNDRLAEFKIVPLQSELGNALMIHYAMDPEDPTSWLYLEDGRAYACWASPWTRVACVKHHADHSQSVA